MTDTNEHALLNTHLKTLRLPTFARNHRPFAKDAARNNLGYDRYLLAWPSRRSPSATATSKPAPFEPPAFRS